MSHTDLPPVKPSAIALGTIFTHTASLAVLAPLFGDTYHRAQAANSNEEFFKSKEAATAAASWGSSLAGSALQTYGVAALINATGTLSYKGAAYLGSLIFMASAAPNVRSNNNNQSSPLQNACTKNAFADCQFTLDHRTSRHRKASHGHHCRHRGQPCVRNRWPQHVPHLLGNKNQPI
jgi:Protein of unknown function (DUF1761)